MNLNYKLTATDTKVILFALSVLPAMELEDTEKQAQLNQICCISAAHKLTTGQNKFTLNEIRVISASLQIVQLINSGELDADSELKSDCARYLFDINRLVPIFELDDELFDKE